MKILKIMKKLYLNLSISLLMLTSSFAQELVIGEERVEPGIVFIFEGAIKDVIIPESNNLSVCLLYTSPSPRD